MNLGAPTDWYDTILILLQHIETESRPYVFPDEPCYLGTVVYVNTLTSMSFCLAVSRATASTAILSVSVDRMDGRGSQVTDYETLGVNMESLTMAIEASAVSCFVRCF